MTDLRKGTDDLYVPNLWYYELLLFFNYQKKLRSFKTTLPDDQTV